MAIEKTTLLGLPYSTDERTDDAYDIIGGLFVKKGSSKTLPEIVDDLYGGNQGGGSTGGSTVIASGIVTIKATEWEDLAPYYALITLGGDYLTKKSVVLFVPNDNKTKELTEDCQITISIDATVDNNANDMVAFVRAASKPTEPLTYRFVVLETNYTADLPIAALVGVDATGGGGLPYGGSPEWLEANGDKSQLYQIDGYVWGYVDSTGWTRSNMRYEIVASEASMTRDGGTPYMLREGDTGTVYEYNEPISGDDVPVYDSLPETANDGDVVAVNGIKYEAKNEVVFIEHNGYISAEVLYDMRLNSSGVPASAAGMIVLPNVDIPYDGNTDCVITIKGVGSINGSSNNMFQVSFYDSNETHLGQISAGYYGVSNDKLEISDGIYSLHLPYTFKPFSPASTQQMTGDITKTAKVRISMQVGGGKNVDKNSLSSLVVNFSSLDKNEEQLTWEEVGTYIPPVAGGWSATADTRAIIDTLDGTAESGAVAVYAKDGYEYTYLDGAGWMQLSEYDTSMEIDSELSISSKNAIQNRAVAVEIDAINANLRVNETNIDTLKSKVNAIASGSGSLGIPGDVWLVWKDSVEYCIEKIKEAQVGRDCVTFPFFSDNHQRLGNSGMLIAYVMKECGMPYCFYGGDAISNGTIASEDVMIEQDKAFDEQIAAYIPSGRFCRAVGNHDGFWKVSSSESHGYTREKVYELFLRDEGVEQHKHFGGDGTYYYVDDLPSKVRFIVLNTNPSTLVGAGNEEIDSDQLSWLENTAMHFDESGWGVVIISHCPISNQYQANVTNAADVIDAVNAYTNKDGADNKPVMIGWFSGHLHRDRIFTEGYLDISDTQKKSLGFHQVTVTSDADLDYDYASGTGIAELKRDDTTETQAIDFVTINKKDRIVTINRLGMFMLDDDNNHIRQRSFTF